MNLKKVGSFIAECRKKKNITQEELSSLLYVTDRAVSKWERGICLPDASKMIDLCNILEISVNELLIGERINMKDYNKKTEELLVELAKQEELKNKKLMANMWILLITDAVFYFGILSICAYILKEGPLFAAIICASTIFFVLVAFYALKLEVDAGYYECKNCHNRYVPSYMTALFAPHISTTRYMKCPKCNKRTWSKKVMIKE